MLRFDLCYWQFAYSVGYNSQISYEEGDFVLLSLHGTFMAAKMFMFIKQNLG